jgi:hypothetical protein
MSTWNISLNITTPTALVGNWTSDFKNTRQSSNCSFGTSGGMTYNSYSTTGPVTDRALYYQHGLGMAFHTTHHFRYPVPLTEFHKHRHRTHGRTHYTLFCTSRKNFTLPTEPPTQKGTGVRSPEKVAGPWIWLLFLIQLRVSCFTYYCAWSCCMVLMHTGFTTNWRQVTWYAVCVCIIVQLREDGCNSQPKHELKIKFLQYLEINRYARYNRTGCVQH